MAARSPAEQTAAWVVLSLIICNICAVRWTAQATALSSDQYGQEGPCSGALQQSSSTASLPAGSGCSGFLGQCSVQLLITLPSNCSGRAVPFPTAVIFNGYDVSSEHYGSIASRLASWGYAVIQYDRSESAPPSNDVELTYFNAMMEWRAAANSTAGSQYGGIFAPAVAVVGHSMGGGLAAEVAGRYPQLVKSAVLLDPVNYALQSLNVPNTGVSRYGQPVAILTAGVRCVDRAGCFPPTASQFQTSAAPASGGCSPDWICCDWDAGSGPPGGAIGGATGFEQLAAVGSWVVKVLGAGHMDFVDWGNAGPEQFTIQCPKISPPPVFLPDILHVIVAFMESRVRGGNADAFLQWAQSLQSSERLHFFISSGPQAQDGQIAAAG